MLDLVRGEPEAERVLALASAVLDAPVADILSGPAEALFTNATAQPLICAVELATWAALSSQLPSPRVFAGYSVGELAAYGCAGALCAGHVQQPGGESPLCNLMEVKHERSARAEPRGTV